MVKLTLQELEQKKDWKEAVIVFTKDSFNKPFTETERSYQVSSDNHYFHSDKISSSLHGNCLDGKDNGVRLDHYMKLLEHEGKRWKVEFAYIEQ